MLKRVGVRVSLVWIVALALPGARAYGVTVRNVFNTARKVAKTTYNAANTTYKVGDSIYSKSKGLYNQQSKNKVDHFKKTQRQLLAFKNLASGTVDLQVLGGVALVRHANVEKMPKRVSILGEDKNRHLLLKPEGLIPGNTRSLDPKLVANFYRLPIDETAKDIQRVWNALDYLGKIASQPVDKFYEELQLQKGNNERTLKPLLQTMETLKGTRFENKTTGSEVKVIGPWLAIFDGQKYMELKPKQVIALDKIPSGATMGVFVNAKENGNTIPVPIADLQTHYTLSGI